MGECLTCKKQSNAPTARCCAKCDLVSGTAAMLAINVATCSCRNTEARTPKFRTAVNKHPAVSNLSSTNTA